MPVTKRTRYEVLKRDNHACRYCGGTAPDVILTVDHVTPVALGGSDDPSNLVAACRDCNYGKGSTSPDDGLVADVAADALRWRQAIAVATEIAERDRAANEVVLGDFYDHWRSWTYGGGKYHYDLPGGWETKVQEIFNAGLTLPEVKEAADIAISNPRVDNEFAYFLGVCRQKVAQRHEVARALIANKDV